MTGRGHHLSEAALLALTRRADARVPESSKYHLMKCRRCEQLLHDLRTLERHLSTEPLEPPAGVVLRAWALREPQPPKRSDASRFVLARIVYDTGATPMVSRVRAATVATQQLWRLSAADLDLRLEPAGLGTPGLLLGQILPRGPLTSGPLGGTVWLIVRGRRPRWAMVGASGEFTLPSPQSRHWSLWVDWGTLRARVEPT